MAEKITLADIENRLQRKNIHELRQVARVLGVSRPADGKKERLVGDLIKICSGEMEPVPRSTRGAPPKSEMYDRQFVADFETCRAELIARRSGNAPANTLELASGDREEGESKNAVFTGVLYKYDKYSFLSVGHGAISRTDDIFVHESFVRRFNLKTGDEVKCTVQRGDDGRAPGLMGVISVNGLAPEEVVNRPDFDESSAVYPNRKITLSPAGAEGNIIDLFSPLAAGQRGLIVGPARSGATTLIYKIAQALTQNCKDICTVCLLVGARPEEISDFAALDGSVVFHTAFHIAEEEKVRVANLALEYAKRRAELGGTVVMLVDNANRLARAYSSVARRSAEFDGGVLKLFSAARAGSDGGSLSIISALARGGNAADEELYSELRDACNMQITLSGELSEKGVFPAIDIKNSFSAHSEKFRGADELALAAASRALPPEQIIKSAHICAQFAQFKEQLK